MVSSTDETQFMQHQALRIDPRYFQVIFQAIFLSYGILILHWNPDWLHYFITIAGCLAFQYAADSIKSKRWLTFREFDRWGFSILISAMGLCLLLKTNEWSTSLLACLITVVSKYIFRWKGKHIFNPSAIGVIGAILLTNDAWLVQVSGVAMRNLLWCYYAGHYRGNEECRNWISHWPFYLRLYGLALLAAGIYLGWPMDHFIHSVSTGSLLLFTFFMISDPRTAPNHPIARIIWAVLIAALSFYLTAFKWKYNTAIWVLVAAAPLVPILDTLFRSNDFIVDRLHLFISILFQNLK